MKINWKVRINNRQFWMAIIPAVALAIQAILAIFGVNLNLETLVGKLIAVVDAIFAVMVILGIVVDPTTAGIGDSDRAMGYEVPWSDNDGV